MSYRFLFVFLLIIDSCTLYAKNRIIEVKSTRLHSYYNTSELLPKRVHVFSADYKTEAIIDRIVAYSGLRRNFIVRATEDVQTATAMTKFGERYLLYNPFFMKTAQQKTHSDWSAISIMAHEIGHHLQGHTLDAMGSSPEREIQADEYSGFVLQKMGATLEEAQAVINVFSANEGTITHPPKNIRLLAIDGGWTRARDLNSMSKFEAASILPAQDLQMTNRFEVKSGLVKDVNSKLIWTRCSIGQKWNGSTCQGVVSKHSWNDIITRHFNYQGYKDWRVPSVEELKTLSFHCNSKHTTAWNETQDSCEGNDFKSAIISKAFPNTPVHIPFWSSSLSESSDDSAWVVDFSDGSERYDRKSHFFAVRLVRNM